MTILGSRDGYNGSPPVTLRLPGKLLEFGGMRALEDRQRYKGDPHDLIAFDEVVDFTESQYTFIIGWNRSSDPKQRCRVLVTSNPPTTAAGPRTWTNRSLASRFGSIVPNYQVLTSCFFHYNRLN